MQQKTTSCISWWKTFSSQQACLRALKRHRWSNEFECPRRDHDNAYVFDRNQFHQCTNCRHQTSVIAGTIFKNTKLSLPKWFAAICVMSADNGGNLVLRLSNMIGVQWRTVQRLLSKLRHALGERDQGCPLRDLIRWTTPSSVTVANHSPVAL